MSDRVQAILDRVVEALRPVDGVQAVVLGGSQASGTATSSSDIDVGIFYSGQHPLDLVALERVAQALDDEHRSGLITQPGAWGPWINGGGWLVIDGVPTDFLFRDLERERQVFDECLRGEISISYQCGHPFGFVSSIYLGEVQVSRVLFEREGCVSALKARLTPFPEVYRRAAVQKFLWECGFSSLCGRKSASKGDVTYAAGSLFRCAIALVQALFALNRAFLLNEKGAFRRLAALEQAPEDFGPAMEQMFSELSAEHINSAFDLVDRYHEEISRMAL